MSRTQSMTLAPDSQSAATESSPARWLLCRRVVAMAISDDAALVRCVEYGQVKPDDYLVNPALDICVQAKDIMGLEPIFKKRTLLGKFSSLIIWLWQQFRG